jgi:hypothetical protein
MHFVIKLLVLALSTCVAVAASAQNAQPPAVQTTTQPPGTKTETQAAGNQSGTAEKNDNCQALMNSAQIKVLSDDQKAALAMCVSEQNFRSNGEIAKAIQNPIHDLTLGPGPNNDIVGRNSWIRGRLGF